MDNGADSRQFLHTISLLQTALAGPFILNVHPAFTPFPWMLCKEIRAMRLTSWAVSLKCKLRNTLPVHRFSYYHNFSSFFKFFQAGLPFLWENKIPA